MDVVSLTPLRVGSLVWQDERAGSMLTVVCKGTYRLLPGQLELAAEQEPLYKRDQHEGGDTARGLYAAAGLVPRKARADVLVVGHAHAPLGEAVRSLVARVSVGLIDKEIEVVGDRVWTREGVPSEPARFTTMPLSYDRAAGGPGTANPLGSSGIVHLPNLQPVGGAPAGRRDRFQPIGFGPLPASFPERRARLGRPGAVRFLDAPLPEGFDHGYFNAAPTDQQLPLLGEGERLILQNLHREHPQLVTVLSAARPRTVAERPGAPPCDVDMRCDTLWIDTDRVLCTLTWRGQLVLAARDEPGRVLVALEQPGERIAHTDVIALVGPLSAPPSILVPAPPHSEHPVSVELDWEVDAAEEDTQDEISTASFPGGLPLPPAAPVLPVPPVPPVPVVRPALGGLRLASSRPPDAGTGDAGSSFLAAARITSVNPAVVIEPPPPEAAAPASEPTRRAPPSPPRRPPRTTLKTVPGAAVQGPTWRDGAASLAPAPVPPSPRPGPARTGGAIDLIWADPAVASKIRRGFGELVAGLPPAAQGDPEAVAVRVLAAGEPRDANGLAAAMASAVGADGGFRPPAVLVAGALRFAFDEVETLRALVIAARPFVAGDPALAEAIDAARALLATPGSPAASELSARIAQRMRGAFDADVELLVARRAYERRALFGGDRIRALVTLPGATVACPVYLPAALANVLPMFQAFEARVLGEAHAAQDPAEAHPVALDTLAIGRVAPAA